MMTHTVLIVDDEYAGRQTIESVLDGEGYRLEMAENGTEAMEKARKHLPDVILLDLMMPDINGFEVCERIRKDKQLAEVPIIILTALDDNSSMLKALEAGADDFISKPFDRYELRARLVGIMRLNRYQKLVTERAKLEQANADLVAAYDATISGWSRAMDLRDRETEGHSQRVAEETVKLATSLGLSEQELIHIRRGALLHDMGKLGIPDSILLKPDELDSDEWKVIKQHPKLAFDMFKSIDYLRPALDIPYCHHEKWDGSGYPRGLKKDAIPLSARIFAIIDVWDALNSDRSYRSAWKKNDALDYIRNQSGLHFEPRIVDLFIKYIIKK
ncbi:MAG: response regulator [Anaerolineae bacterium]|nr:response regulator [Anaerolineae bacterium]MDK1080946.1 response regulator [Anaerolineae bacterium]